MTTGQASIPKWRREGREKVKWRERGLGVWVAVQRKFKLTNPKKMTPFQQQMFLKYIHIEISNASLKLFLQNS